MAITKCPECGGDISGEVNKCPHCGHPIKKKPAVKKPVVVISAVCAAVVLIAAAVFFVMNANPVSRYIRLFHDGKTVDADTVYHDKIETDAERAAELAGIQNAEMDVILAQYLNDEIVFEEADEALDKYLGFKASAEYAASVSADLSALKASKEAYEAAVNDEQDGDLESAIKNYDSVIKEDTTYEEAREKVISLKERLKVQLLEEAEAYSNDRKYKDAIASIEEAVSILGGSDEFTALKEKYEQLKAEQYVKVDVIDKTATPKNTKKWIFSNYVKLHIKVTNNCDKEIKGVEGKLTISDLFGKEIMKSGCDFVGQTIQPGETQLYDDLGMVCNEFISEHMELFKTDYSDLKFSYEVSSIVFTDGTTIKPE